MILSAFSTSFQSTPPMQGATDIHSKICTEIGVSIHAPYAGSDKETVSDSGSEDLVSIHAPYAGSDAGLNPIFAVNAVSIHAPYAGSDMLRRRQADTLQIVSIHAPYAGSDW